MRTVQNLSIFINLFFRYVRFSGRPEATWSFDTILDDLARSETCGLISGMLLGMFYSFVDSRQTDF